MDGWLADRYARAMPISTVRTVCLMLAFLLATPPASGEVTLTQDGSTVRVAIDGELFAALQTAEGQAKPYLYPVMQPGWSTQPFAAGHFVTVADTMLDPDATDHIGLPLPPSTQITVDRREGDRLHLLAPLAGWIAAADAVPVSGLAVRRMDDDPLPYDRKNPAAYDHPHHRGVWIAIDEVADTKFWSEEGRIDAVSVDVLDQSGDPARLRMTAWWYGKDDDATVVLEQVTHFAFHSDGLIDLTTVFSPPEGRDVTFGDTKEGLVGVRMPDDRREKSAGLIRNADGDVTESATWGRPSDWVDYIGPVGGPDDADAAAPGVSLFAHPSNPRASRYHVRGYGLFSINPFGPNAYSKGEQPAAPLTLSGDETITLRYGVWIHGDADRDAVAARYAKYGAE